jgi:hypothetical protein
VPPPRVALPGQFRFEAKQRLRQKPGRFRFTVFNAAEISNGAKKFVPYRPRCCSSKGWRAFLIGHGGPERLWKLKGLAGKRTRAKTCQPMIETQINLDR